MSRNKNQNSLVFCLFEKVFQRFFLGTTFVLLPFLIQLDFLIQSVIFPAVLKYQSHSDHIQLHLLHSSHFSFCLNFATSLDRFLFIMIPSLPTELIENIIRLSLPPIRFSSYRERYNVLVAYSLVSSVWRSLAQEELGKHLVIGSTKGLKLVIQRLKLINKDGHKISPLSLHLEGRLIAPDVEVKEILELCSTIKELFVAGELFPTSLFTSFDWSSKCSLRSFIT